MENHSNKKQWPQYLAAIIATLSMAVTGSHIGWTSPILPRLKEPNSTLTVTSNQASWVASLYILGSIPGNFLASFIVDSVGRKISLLISGIPMTIGWILIIFARNPYVLYVSRFISGLGQGIVYVVGPMYLGEIADEKIRGSLGSFIKLMVTFGELYAHAIGPFFSYEVLAYSCIVLPIIFFVTFIWMPESPYYLIIRNRREEVEKSLQWLNRYTCKEDLKNDMDQMEKTVAFNLKNKGHFWDMFSTRGNRRAVLICFGLQVVLQLSGIAAIESYTQEILEGSGSNMSAGTTVIILSVLQLIAGIVAVALVDRVGRRPLLLLTTFLAGVALSISAGFYFLQSNLNYDVKKYGNVLVAAIIGYELIVALGLSPLPYLMLGELFPTNIKGVAVSLVNLWTSLLAFIVSKMHQVISDYCGIYMSFIVYALTCCVGMVFIALVVPETTGKSLLEIQNELNCGSKKIKQKEKQEDQENTAL
ncbi:facilitated trehalose transporter Tret1-like [Copidosoma floridanum]|uniref:facilitated trehalose transporter Tret1-like n=1 Tax=Copidosoma floridanum TaxID=29053 RepID=UPI0006C9642E|nr:facilitated trehalose transporter Tret1-like [Copidosoma floridanum]